MGMDQTVGVALGFTLKGKEDIDDFLSELVRVGKNSGTSKPPSMITREKNLAFHKANNPNFDPSLLTPVEEDVLLNEYETALEDFMDSPEIKFINNSAEWKSICLDRYYDENFGEDYLVVYDNNWSKSVNESYDSVEPISLPNPNAYDGPLLELIDSVEVYGLDLSYVFYAYVN